MADNNAAKSSQPGENNRQVSYCCNIHFIHSFRVFIPSSFGHIWCHMACNEWWLHTVKSPHSMKHTNGGNCSSKKRQKVRCWLAAPCCPTLHPGLVKNWEVLLLLQIHKQCFCSHYQWGLQPYVLVSPMLIPNNLIFGSLFQQPLGCKICKFPNRWILCTEKLYMLHWGFCHWLAPLTGHKFQHLVRWRTKIMEWSKTNHLWR